MIDPFQISDSQRLRIISDTTLMLGKLHWQILRAEKLMDSKRARFWEEHKFGVTIHREKPTDFDVKVGKDEIDWWINHEEQNPQELGDRSKAAMDAAQILRTDSIALRGFEPLTYDALLLKFKDFADSHGSQVSTLYEYVDWLRNKSELAPEILFTYKVWGSTRRSDRRIAINNELTTPDQEELSTLLKLTEIVLGLSDSRFLAVDKAFGDIFGEAQESGEIEEHGDEFRISDAHVLRRAANYAADECTTYFTELRDSLRETMIYVEKREAKENLVASDIFWRALIGKATISGRIESQYWDFKETLTMWHAEDARVRASAKVTTAEDVAAFANADGGCLFIGVRDDKTVAGVGSTERERENRVKVLHDALTELIEYPRQIWTVHQLLIKGDQSEERLCLVIVVGRACEPVGVKGTNGGYTYPVRHGTGMTREAPNKLRDARFHEKTDNYDFLNQLRQFVRDN